MAGKFHAFLAQILVEIGKNCLECIPCFWRCQQLGIRDYPKAKLMMFQSCLEKWDQDVQEILFRLVEGTEVRTPGHISHDADSGVSKFRHDRVSLSGVGPAFRNADSRASLGSAL